MTLLYVAFAGFLSSVVLVFVGIMLYLVGIWFKFCLRLMWADTFLILSYVFRGCFLLLFGLVCLFVVG